MKMSSQKQTYALVILLLVSFMSSCVQTQNIQIPTFTEVASSAIPSQSLPPKVLFTETPTPAKTLDPFAATFSAQLATSKARKAAIRTAAYATLASRNAVCEDGYDFGFFAEDVLREIDFYKTNKGESWTVVKCLPEKSNLLSGYTKVLNSDGSKIWTVSYASLPLPGRYEFISGYKIDSTNNFLYLVASNFFGRDGWCPSCFFGYGSPLYRLELSSGKVTIILPYIENGYYIDMSISPDVRYLIYSDSRDGNHVYIKDLISGNDKRIELQKNYVINGGFTWITDSENLVFAAGIDGWEDGKAGISLFRLNLNTMSLQTLLLNDNRNLVPRFNSDSSKTWTDDNMLNLVSIKVDERTFSSNEWSINVATNEVIRLSTPTPTPAP